MTNAVNAAAQACAPDPLAYIASHLCDSSAGQHTQSDSAGWVAYKALEAELVTLRKQLASTEANLRAAEEELAALPQAFETAKAETALGAEPALLDRVRWSLGGWLCGLPLADAVHAALAALPAPVAAESAVSVDLTEEHEPTPMQPQKKRGKNKKEGGGKGKKKGKKKGGAAEEEAVPAVAHPTGKGIWIHREPYAPHAPASHSQRLGPNG